MERVPTVILPLKCDLSVHSQSVGSTNLALSSQAAPGGSRSSTSEIITMKSLPSLRMQENSLTEVPSSCIFSYPGSREDRGSPEACLSSTIKGLLS